MGHHENIVRIKSVNNLLLNTGVRFAFVGGATVSLYATRETDDVRPTDDVDVVVEITTYGAAFTKLTERLLDLGFTPDTGSKVICRYLYQGLTVDIMPVAEEVLGFKNRWYEPGLNNSVTHSIDEHSTVEIFTAPYFIASKLDAFNDRGNRDGRTSTDFEDIIFVMDNRPQLWDEIQLADKTVRNYIVDQLSSLYNSIYFEEWVMAHTGSHSPLIFPQHIFDGIKSIL